MLNLIHEENTFFIHLIADTIETDENKKIVKDYIKACNDQKVIILSGIYEDDIDITD